MGVTSLMGGWLALVDVIEKVGRVTCVVCGWRVVFGVDVVVGVHIIIVGVDGRVVTSMDTVVD